MATPFKQKMPLVPAQTALCDLLEQCFTIPSVPIERRIELPSIDAAPHSPQAVFLKATALLQTNCPHLRCAYIPYPWARLVQHDHCAMMVPIEKEVNGAQCTYFEILRSPETLSLAEIDHRLQQWQDRPVEELSWTKKIDFVRYWPRLLRRKYWSMQINWSAGRRARLLGTGAVSSAAGPEWGAHHPLAALMPTISYRPDGRDQTVIRLMYDHRIMDGGTAARALQQLETILHDQIRPELLMPRLSKVA